MFGHFTTLCMKGLTTIFKSFDGTYRSSCPEVFCIKDVLKKRKKENTRVGVSILKKLQTWGLQFYKKRLRYMCFPGNFVTFLRTPFMQNNSRWLLQYLHYGGLMQVMFAVVLFMQSYESIQYKACLAVTRAFDRTSEIRWLQRDSNLQPLNSYTNTQPFR